MYWLEIKRSKRIALNGVFLHSIKYFKKRIGMEFNNPPLIIEQNNYATKIINVCTVYDLDNWPKIPLKIFTLEIVFSIY